MRIQFLIPAALLAMALNVSGMPVFAADAKQKRAGEPQRKAVLKNVVRKHKAEIKHQKKVKRQQAKTQAKAAKIDHRSRSKKRKVSKKIAHTTQSHKSARERRSVHQQNRKSRQHSTHHAKKIAQTTQSHKSARERRSVYQQNRKSRLHSTHHAKKNAKAARKATTHHRQHVYTSRGSDRHNVNRKYKTRARFDGHKFRHKNHNRHNRRHYSRSSFSLSLGYGFGAYNYGYGYGNRYGYPYYSRYDLYPWWYGNSYGYRDYGGYQQGYGHVGHSNIYCADPHHAHYQEAWVDQYSDTQQDFAYSENTDGTHGGSDIRDCHRETLRDQFAGRAAIVSSMVCYNMNTQDYEHTGAKTLVQYIS